MTFFFHALGIVLIVSALTPTQRRHLDEQLNIGPNCDAEVVLPLLRQEAFSEALVDRYIESRCEKVEYFFIDHRKKNLRADELKSIFDRKLVMEERIALFLQKFLAYRIPELSDRVSVFSRVDDDEDDYSLLDHSTKDNLGWALYLSGRANALYEYLPHGGDESNGKVIKSTQVECKALISRINFPLEQGGRCFKRAHETKRMTEAIERQKRTADKICNALKNIFHHDRLCRKR